MEFLELKAQMEQARRFQAQAVGATFDLVLPTEHAWRVTVEGHRDAAGRFLEAKALRELLNAAVTGWSGIKTSHFLPGSGEEAVPFSAQARAELLDSRQDIADELALELGKRSAERRKAREEARKNS